MKLLKIIPLALLLTGCQTMNTVMGGPETHYNCVQGSTLLSRASAGRDQMEVVYTYQGQVVYNGTLESMPSDFGERFRADDGTSFWLNESKGLFSRPGEGQILCHLQP